MTVRDGFRTCEFQWSPDRKKTEATCEFATRDAALSWLSALRAANPCDFIHEIRSLLAYRAFTQLSRLSDQEILEETAMLLHTQHLMVVAGEKKNEAIVLPAVSPLQQFEDWMFKHLKQFFPAQCAAAGEQRVREMVQHGINRAAVYGITARRDVSKYVDLMIVFGRDFDTDIRQRWAGEILRKRGESGAMMKALLQAAKATLGSR